MTRPGGRTAVAGSLLATVLAFGLVACGHRSNGLGHLNFSGQVSLTALHGSTHPAGNGSSLHDGDRIEVTSGEAIVTLAPNGVLHLRGATVLVMGKIPLLQVGDVLVQPAHRPLRVAAVRATLLVPEGAAQLQVGATPATLTAKVYQSTSELDVPGNPSAVISAPRQVSLPSETPLPVAALPLAYDSADPWDHLYLATAMTISTQLGAAVSGFDAQLAANQGVDPAFYQQLLPTLGGQTDFVEAFDGAQARQPIGLAAPAKPGDYLIATVIALRSSRGNFATRLSNELAFSAQGANWGYVAFDQGVTDLNGVLADVLAAIGRASLPFTKAPSSQIAIGPPPGPTPTSRPNRSTPPPPTTAPARRTTNPPTTTTTTTIPAVIFTPPPMVPGILGSLLNPLLDPLLQALDNILAGRH